MSRELVPFRSGATPALARSEDSSPPAIVERAGAAARFAWDEFFDGEVRNAHTRKAYQHAVRLSLAWCEERELELAQCTPALVGQYFTDHPGGPATKKQHLAALRRLFDTLVVRHAVIFNPALSVRTERYEVIEGKTPEIGVEL